jgi:integrase
MHQTPRVTVPHRFNAFSAHSYGTWLADDGIVPNKLAKVMGHEDIATTMQLYVRRTEDHDAIRDLLDG